MKEATSKHHADAFKIVSFANAGFVRLGFLDNWACAIAQAKIPLSSVRLYALDKVVAERAKRLGLEPVFLDHKNLSKPSSAVSFRKKGWGDLVFSKVEVIAQELAAGNALVYADMDAVILRDPRPLAGELAKEKPLWFQSDTPVDTPRSLRYACTGAFVAIPSPEAKIVFDPDPTKFTSYDCDQPLIQDRLLSLPADKTGLLDDILFPNGQRLQNDPKSAQNKALVAHYNWMNNERKLWLMRQYGMWFAAPTLRERIRKTSATVLRRIGLK